MRVIYKAKNIEDTNSLAKIISSFIFKGSVILLKGDLGSGKTTFTKALGKEIGIKDEINSPTFNILKCYFNSDKNKLNLYHIDGYRLEGLDTLSKDIGLDEVIEGDGVSVIEWPQFIEEFLDYLKTLNLELTIQEDDSRLIEITSSNEAYKPLFNLLKENSHE